MPKQVRATDPTPRTRAGTHPVTTARIPGRALAFQLATLLAGPDQRVEVAADGSVMVVNGRR